MVLAITIPELAAMLAYGPVGMFFTPDAPGQGGVSHAWKRRSKS